MSSLFDRFVPDWRNWWKWFSTWAALVLTAMPALAIAFPEATMATLSMLPPEMRAYVAPPVWAALWGGSLILRLWKQVPKKAT